MGNCVEHSHRDRGNRHRDSEQDARVALFSLHGGRDGEGSRGQGRNRGKLLADAGTKRAGRVFISQVYGQRD